MNLDFTEKNFFSIIEKLKLYEKSKIFIASDLAQLGIINNKLFTLDLIYNGLKKINPKITLVVPTASLNIINSNMIFDLKNTKSYQMGSFSEYIRKNILSVRSMDPLWSLSGNGPDAKKILSNISKHSYDENSAFQRLYKNNYYFLSLGKHPRFMLSIIHHIENKMNVSYRFKKGFKIKYYSDNKILEDTFYLDVLKDEYRNKPRAQNKKIFDNFEKNFEYKFFKVGKGEIGIFSMNDFLNNTTNLLNKDEFAWFK